MTKIVTEDNLSYVWGWFCDFVRKEKAGADVVIEEALEEKPLAQELTDREMEIVPLLAAGLTSQQIADKVYLSLATIKWYRKRLLEKFQASNSAELVSILKEKGLL
ncbi:MAG: helix-turn-helix transcriptional regulator [Bacteroidales bacterium]|nr:helix-turn-helix transcriptional regulator [Bacteroidales bacterium]